MPISHEHKIIFIHIPKCAGSSIEEILGVTGKRTEQGVDGISNFYTEGYSLERIKMIPRYSFTQEQFDICKSKNMQHYTFVELCKMLHSGIVKNYKKIAVVRNPYTRLLSEFFHLQQKRNPEIGITLNDLVFDRLKMNVVERNDKYDGHLETQTSFLINEQGNLNSIDKIYRFENLQECFKDINLLTGNNIQPHLRQSKKAVNNDELLTAELKEAIYEFYKEDFINFNYSK